MAAGRPPSALPAPVVDVFHPQKPYRVALFATSQEPTYFRYCRICWVKYNTQPNQ